MLWLYRSLLREVPVPYEVVKQVDITVQVEQTVEKVVQVPVPVERRVRQEVRVPYTVQKVIEVPQPYTVERVVQTQVRLQRLPRLPGQGPGVQGVA